MEVVERTVSGAPDRYFLGRFDRGVGRSACGPKPVSMRPWLVIIPGQDDQADLAAVHAAVIDVPGGGRRRFRWKHGAQLRQEPINSSIAVRTATLVRMTPPLPAARCPCGSGAAYDICCEPLHDGASAKTAEALMRSRYSAYATGQPDYVFRTWHPRTRPVDISPISGVTWVNLEILRTVDGGVSDDTGTVEFRADYDSADGKHVLHETSRFQRRAGRWVYVDGDITQ